LKFGSHISESGVVAVLITPPSEPHVAAA
jgi:hypothetical protein